MGRHAKPIPDKKKGKQLEHYVNGRDKSDGMHPGIRRECKTCEEIVYRIAQKGFKFINTDEWRILYDMAKSEKDT